MDFRAQDRAALELCQQVADRLRPEDHLDQPTPCPPWSVRDLLCHMVGQHLRFAAVAREMEVESLRTVATAAVRDAANGQVLLDAAARIGLPVELLSGEQEAIAAGMGVDAGIEGTPESLLGIVAADRDPDRQQQQRREAQAPGIAGRQTGRRRSEAEPQQQREAALTLERPQAGGPSIVMLGGAKRRPRGCGVGDPAT